tara:strand:- start:397 stop:579 length:183 start_codon:yes stop_codon:yes gene_type:complete
MGMEDIYIVYAQESSYDPFLDGVYRDKSDALLRLDCLEMNGMRSWIVEEKIQWVKAEVEE